MKKNFINRFYSFIFSFTGHLSFNFYQYLVSSSSLLRGPDTHSHIHLKDGHEDDDDDDENDLSWKIKPHKSFLFLLTLDSIFILIENKKPSSIITKAKKKQTKC